MFILNPPGVEWLWPKPFKETACLEGASLELFLHQKTFCE